MRRLNKIVVLFLLSLIIIGVTVIFYYLTDKGTEQSSTFPQFKSSNLPPPVIPESTDDTFTVKLNVNENDVDIPKELPLLTIAPVTLTQGQSDAIAKNLGFTKPALIANDVRRGRQLVYSSDDSSMIITLATGEIRYTKNTFSKKQNVGLSDNEISETARKFLIDNQIVKEEIFGKSQVAYYQTVSSEELRSTSKENADYYQVNFSFNLSKLNILSLNPTMSPITVRVLTDGTIFSSSIQLLKNVEQTKEFYNIKNFDQLKESLNNSELVTLDEGNLYPGDLQKNSIQSVEIIKIEIVYLLDQSNSYLIQPIFLLKGKAKIANIPEGLDAVLYLPAVY